MYSTLLLTPKVIAPAATTNEQKSLDVTPDASPKTRRRLFKVKRRESPSSPEDVVPPELVATPPPKETTIELDPVVKRGRGRPRKIRTPEELQAIEDEKIAKEQRKRDREIIRKQRAIDQEMENAAKVLRKMARSEKSAMRAQDTEKHRAAVLEKRNAVLSRLHADAAAAMEKFAAKKAAVEAYIAKYGLGEHDMSLDEDANLL
jgi:hypothetical protein